MNLMELQLRIRQKTLKLRALDRYVNKVDFEYLFKEADEKLKAEIVKCLEAFDFDGLIMLLKRRPLDQMNVMELRYLASGLCIPLYRTMDKPTLLREIRGMGYNG